MANKMNWTPAAIALLGTAPDTEVAYNLGCDVSTVWRKRDSLGIPRYGARSREELALLGTMPDAQLAKRWGVKRDSVGYLRRSRGVVVCRATSLWTAVNRSLLGTMSDAAVAQRVGRSKEAVTAMRRARGVSSASQSLPHPHLEDIQREYTTRARPPLRLRRGMAWIPTSSPTGRGSAGGSGQQAEHSGVAEPQIAAE